jgi:hypothetical protein
MFASYRMRFPAESTFVAFGLGFIILYLFYVYETSTLPNPDNQTNSTSEVLERGDYSGILELGNSIKIFYEHAWKEPVVTKTSQEGFTPPLPKDINFNWINVNFGNGRVTINPKSNQATINGTTGDIKISVQIGDVIKAKIG